jgi:hypothetical protein
MAINSTQATAFADAFDAILDGHATDSTDLVAIRDAVDECLRALGAQLGEISMDVAGVGYDGYHDYAPDVTACKAQIRSILGV